MVYKKSKKHLKEKDIQKLGEKIKENKKLSYKDQQRVNRKVFVSLFMSAIAMFVFIFLLMGYSNISTSNYLVDLKFFAIVAIAVTICIFEYAYKKDNDLLAIIGIESLVASFIILSLPYILEYNIYPYQYYLLTFAVAFMVYYIIKTFIIYYRECHRYRKSAKDIKNILKKEEI